MKNGVRGLLACIGLGLAMNCMALDKDAACDLVDASAVAALLGAQPSRKFTGSTSTVAEMYSCLFQAPGALFRVNLVHMNSVDSATRTFVNNTASTKEVSFQSEPGLGDAAASWQMIGTEAYGYTVRKGARTVLIEVRWNQGRPKADPKEHLRPIVQAAARKL